MLFKQQCSSHPGLWSVSKLIQGSCPEAGTPWSPDTVCMESCWSSSGGAAGTSHRRTRTGRGWDNCASRQWPRSPAKPGRWLCCSRSRHRRRSAPVLWRTTLRCRASSNRRRRPPPREPNGLPASWTTGCEKVSRWSGNSRKARWQSGQIGPRRSSYKDWRHSRSEGGLCQSFL